MRSTTRPAPPGDYLITLVKHSSAQTAGLCVAGPTAPYSCCATLIPRARAYFHQQTAHLWAGGLTLGTGAASFAAGAVGMGAEVKGSRVRLRGSCLLPSSSTWFTFFGFTNPLISDSI